MAKRNYAQACNHMCSGTNFSSYAAAHRLLQCPYLPPPPRLMVCQVHNSEVEMQSRQAEKVITESQLEQAREAEKAIELGRGGSIPHSLYKCKGMCIAVHTIHQCQICTFQLKLCISSKMYSNPTTQGKPRTLHMDL